MDGIYYNEVEYGTALAGFIRIAQNGMEQLVVEMEKRSAKVLYDMVINRNDKTDTKFATILHELAHLYCGHLGTHRNGGGQARPGKNQENQPRVYAG